MCVWYIPDYPSPCSPGLAFNAPLTMIALTYFMMHFMSTALRARLRYQSKPEVEPLLRRLSFVEWSWKVLPVAAASGLEVHIVCSRSIRVL